MGFYDGLGGVTDTASAWHLADTLGLPVLLVVPAKGASLTLAAQINGLKTFRTPSRIVGVLLNDCTSALYKMLKPMLERETGLPVLGYLPRLPEASIESRHLGLKTAGEIAGLQQKDRPSCGCAGAGLGAVPGPDRPACTAGSACRPRPGAHPHRRCAGRSLLLCLRRNAGGPDRRRGRACPIQPPARCGPSAGAWRAVSAGRLPGTVRRAAEREPLDAGFCAAGRGAWSAHRGRVRRLPLSGADARRRRRHRLAHGGRPAGQRLPGRAAGAVRVRGADRPRRQPAVPRRRVLPRPRVPPLGLDRERHGVDRRKSQWPQLGL